MRSGFGRDLGGGAVAPLQQPESVRSQRMAATEQPEVRPLDCGGHRQRKHVRATVRVRSDSQGAAVDHVKAEPLQGVEDVAVARSGGGSGASPPSHVRRRPEVSVVVQQEESTGTDDVGDGVHGFGPERSVGVGEEPEGGHQVDRALGHEFDQAPHVAAHELSGRHPATRTLEHALSDVDAENVRVGQHAGDDLGDPSGATGHVDHEPRRGRCQETSRVRVCSSFHSSPPERQLGRSCRRSPHRGRRGCSCSPW